MTPPNLPSLELIESLHSFPGVFTFKVVADSREDLLGDALTLAQHALGEERPYTHTTRHSAKGQHTAVTLNLHLKSSKEVHLVYEKLMTIVGLRALF